MIFFLIVLDGCSIHSFIKAQTPFLDSMGEKFFKNFNCTAVLPTATYTGHSSIVSGTFPERHGMVGNQFFDRKDNLIKHFDNFDPSEYIQAPTLFELFNPLNSMAVSMPITKGAKYVFPMKKLNETPLEDKNEIVFNKSMEILKKYNIKLGIINFIGIDGFGEHYGPNNKKYLKEISKVDQFISQIYEYTKDKSIFIITADHGMAEITKRFDLNKFFKKEEISIRCLDSHRASHLYCNANYGQVLEILNNLKEIDKIYLKSQTEKIKLFHERTGDIVLFANKKIELEKKNLKGSHGGLSKDEFYVPLFIFGKKIRIKDTFKNNKRTFSIVDIAPTVIKISNLQIHINFQGNAII
ncbi:MAG: alkaline phosphatase family protein [Candidatus Helarchaeota archaeon]